MQKTLTKTSVLLFSLVMNPGYSHAEKSRSFSASFLQLQPSARQLALGDSQVAATGHLEGHFSNPALLGTMSIPEIFISHNSSFLDNNHETLGVGLPFRNQALGATLQYSQSSSIKRTILDNSGNAVNDLGEFKPSVGVARIGWAFRPVQRLSVGFNLKTWKEELDKKSYGGVAADLGLISESVVPGIDLGISVQNLGGKQNGFDLPRKFDMGAAYQPQKPNLKFLRFLTNFSSMETSRSINLGLEADNRNIFSLRGGYKISLDENIENLNGLSLGAAFRYRGWQLDYAWKTTSELEDIHMFSLTIGLGLSPEEKKLALHKLDSEINNRIQEKAVHHFSLAQQLAQNKNWEGALRELNTSLTWDPSNSKAKEAFSSVLYQKNKSEAGGHYTRGQEALNQREWMDALLHFQEAIKLDPQHKAAAQALKEIQIDRREKFSKSGTPDSASQKIFQQGVSHYIEGNFQSAIEEWQKISTERVKFPELREYMAKARANLLEVKLSVQSGPIKGDKQQIETLARNAYTYYTLGNMKEAIAAWEKVATLDPSNEEAKWALKQMREKKSVESDENSGTTNRKVQELNSQAFNEYSAGRLENSIRLWKKALSVDPRDSRIRSNIQRVENELVLKESMQ